MYRSVFYPLVRRTSGIELPIVQFIMGETESAARRPEYAQISIIEYQMLTGKSKRMIFLALAALREKAFIAFDGRGGVKACPENFDKAPLPAARTCRQRTKAAAVHAAASIAALMAPAAGESVKLTSIGNEEISVEIQSAERQLPGRPDEEMGECRAESGGSAETERVGAVRIVGCDGHTDKAECGNGGPDSGIGSGQGDERTGAMDSGVYLVVARGDIRTTLPPELKLTTVADEANCKKPETYCPWNWACPHLSTASPLVSIETRNIKEPTTTGARSPLPAETENAYLARFLDPATRIGEALQIDDDAAGRMWRASIARNPELTPREFVLIVRMKLQEWRRVDDTSPGIRVRSLTGLLMRSMPSAVVGALHSLAREQAPADLERDCEAARAYLTYAVATPRDRAWARAILAEAESKT